MAKLKSAFSLPKVGLGLGRALVLTATNWGIQKASTNSNLWEHTVQRGKVDKRRDKENSGSEQSMYHVIIFTVHVRLAE